MQNAQKNACNLKKFQYNKGEKPNRTSTDIFWKEGKLMYKKRFLRLVSAVLALCMMAALLPTAAFADAATSNEFSYTHQGKTLQYTVNADGTTVSVAWQGKDDAVSDDVVIPETVKDEEGTEYTVTSIGTKAFYKCSELTSVEIPSSVTSIGDSAFYDCYWLTSVEIPSGVISIGEGAFGMCDRLTDVTFEANSQLTSIGKWAFCHSIRLKELVIPEGVKTIGDYVFQECGDLQTVTIPASVTSVGIDIFDLNLYKTAKTIIYGGTEEQWNEFFKKVKLPEGSTVQYENYTVQFDPNGHGTAPENVHVESGKTIAEPTLSETGYNLDGWYYTEKGVEKKFVFGDNGTPVTSSMTLKAKWSPIPYQLTVNSEDRGFHVYDEEVTVDEPTKEGYTFAGWTVETKNVTPQKGDDGKWRFKMPAGNVTLTAKWSPISYQLTVDSEDRGFHDCDAEVTVDEPTKEGYTFAGWTVETKNVTPTKGDDGKWSFKMPAGNVTLTAEWKINRYTVKFMNGEDEVKSITADYNSTIAGNNAPVAPVKEGFVFGGWYSDSETFVFGETKVTRDLTLTAKWTKGSYTLTVDGSAEGHDYDEEVTVDEPTKEGYTFAGWTVEPKNVTPQKGDDGKWSFKMPAGNVTLTAKWEINEYTVVFVTAHDNTPNSLTVKHGETISGDRVLKADGYEFGGWYNGTEKFVFGENGTKVTGNLTLTARWTEAKKPEPKPEPKPDPKPVVYEIVVDNGTAYLDDGATAIHTAEEGQTVILKVNPEALTEGFAFDKWEIVSGDVKLADETASETTFEMPASDVELKATVKAVESPAAPAAINPASVMAGTVVLGVGAVSVGWSAYHIATELYLKWVLPQGIIPTTRGQLALLLWNQADQPAVESTALYTDIDASDEQTAARWVIENKKMELVNSDEADVFEPDLPVDIFAVAKAWRKK